MIGDYVKFAVGSITHRRLRSWLTMVGILIGITAVVALTSLGQGLTNTINAEFEKVGANRIIIAPGGGSGTAAMASMGGFASAKLTDKDVKVVRTVRGVDSAAGMLRTTERVTFEDESKYVGVFCLPPDSESMDYLETLDFFFIEQGRMIEPGETRRAVVGYDLWAGDFFDKQVRRGNCITVGGECLPVVGLNERTGAPPHDQKIVIAASDCERLFNKSTGEKTMIAAKIEDGYDPGDVSESIERKLRKSRGVKEGEEDFSVQTAEQMMQTFTQIISVVQVVITGIAAISLLVGAVGIMNTMYTSVIERTDEIGVMKAVGARNKDIMALFLIEAGMLGAVGGIIGTSLGLSISKAVEYYAINHGLPELRVHMGMDLILGVLAFSFIIGSLSGALPARQAAKLQPVEALRK